MLTNSFQDISKGVLTPPQGFCILMNAFEFLKFSALGGIPQCVIHR